MEGTKELITTDAIRSKVYILRGQQVMLDQDLAEIYGYQVKNLNQQVNRNLTRFPEVFMFQLTKEEVELVKSQFVTSRNINYFEGQEGGRRNYHTHLQNKEFICLRQFFVENWQNSRVYL